MTLVAVSTVVRRTPPEEHSSFLRLVDLEGGRVVATVAVPESPLRAHDPNPRGGLRGTRGVAGVGDRLVVASHERLFVLDSSWRLQREITHPWMAATHDVFAERGGIWVTSTASALLLKFTWAGDLVARWRWSEDRELASALGYQEPPGFDDSIDYRVPFPGIGVHNDVHLNAVVRDGRRLLVSLGLVRSPAARRRQALQSAAGRVGGKLPIARRLVTSLRLRRGHRRQSASLPADRKRGRSHAIVEIELTDGDQPGRARVLWHQREIETPKHNVWLARGTLLFNDSDAGELVGVDLDSGEIAFKLPIPGSPPFARGLHPLSEDEVVVGSQRPAAIYPVRLGERSVGEAIELGGKPWETVYAICEVPEGFSRSLEGFGEWAGGYTTSADPVWASGNRSWAPEGRR